MGKVRSLHFDVDVDKEQLTFWKTFNLHLTTKSSHLSGPQPSSSRVFVQL